MGILLIQTHRQRFDTDLKIGLLYFHCWLEMEMAFPLRLLACDDAIVANTHRTHNIVPQYQQITNKNGILIDNIIIYWCYSNHVSFLLWYALLDLARIMKIIYCFRHPIVSLTRSGFVSLCSFRCSFRCYVANNADKIVQYRHDIVTLTIATFQKTKQNRTKKQSTIYNTAIGWAKRNPIVQPTHNTIIGKMKTNACLGTIYFVLRHLARVLYKYNKNQIFPSNSAENANHEINTRSNPFICWLFWLLLLSLLLLLTLKMMAREKTKMIPWMQWSKNLFIQCRTHRSISFFYASQFQ